MSRNFPILIALCAIILSLSASSFADTVVYIRHIKDGVFSVYDPRNGTTVYVRDPKEYLKKKYRANHAEGFGKKIDHDSFAKGTDPVAETAEATAEAVGSAANTALSAADYVPSWRRFTRPIRNLFRREPRSDRQF